MHVLDRHEGGILVRETTGAFLELGGVLRGPPVAQVPLRVELAPLVVEAVRQLVADDRADASEVGGVVGAVVVIRGLQDTGGKVDVVHLRIVVGVDRGRGHQPLAAIDRSADLAEAAGDLEGPRAGHVPGQIVARDSDAAVVAPGVRVADLVPDRLQLGERLLLRHLGHPRQGLDVTPQRLLQGRDQLQGALLPLGAEGPLDVELPQRLSEEDVGEAGAALPARADLAGAAQRLAVEVEARARQPPAENRRGRARQVPAQVVLPVVERCRVQKGVEALEEVGNGHVQVRRLRRAHGGEVVLPFQRRGERFQIVAGHLVVDVERVAALHLLQRHAGQRRLDAEDPLRRQSGALLRVSEQLEHPHQVVAIAIARLARLGVVLEVVVAVRQTEPALVDDGDDRGGVLRVLLGAETEQQTGPGVLPSQPQVDALGMQAGDLRDQGLLRLDGGDPLQLGLQRVETPRLDSRLVHAGGVKVTDHPLHPATPGVRRRRFLENLPQDREVALLQLAAAPPGPPVGRDRVALHPRAAGVLVEIDAGIDAGVERRLVDAAPGNRLGVRRSSGVAQDTQRQDHQDQLGVPHGDPLLQVLPVCPKPPPPRPVAGRSSVSTSRARVTGAMTSWAIRSPRLMVTGSCPRLIATTAISPR